MNSFIYRGPYSDLPEEELIGRLDHHRGIIAVDTETVNTNDYTCIGIGVYIGADEGFYFQVFPRTSPYLPQVMGMLGDRDIRKIYHNGQGFDLEVLGKLARDEGLTTPDDVGFEDSEIMAKVGGLPGGLQRIGEEWLGATDLFSIKDLFDEFGTGSMLNVPWERVGEKCLNDCRTTWELYHYMDERLTSRQRDCYEVDRRLIPVLRKIQGRGLALRQGVLREYEDNLTRTVIRIERECDAEANFHPGSNMQVGYVLAARGHILPFTKSKKQLQVNEEMLEEIDDPLAGMVLEYRKATKLLSTYVRPWLEKDRAYTHFRIDLATGRLASGRVNGWDTVNRNLQNIPPEVRQIFRPDDNLWTWADYSQIELRVLAGMSRDKIMMDAYATGKDLHQISASTMRVPRGNAKTFNFAMVYGGGDKIISKRAGIELNEVRKMRAIWNQLYSGAKAFMDRQYYEHGDAVESDYGRLMRLPEMIEGYDYNPRAFAAHVGKCAINYPIQGTAADIIKRGMLKLDEDGVDLRLQIHDEYLVNGNWIPDSGLEYIHPEIHTPMETKKGLVWN